MKTVSTHARLWSLTLGNFAIGTGMLISAFAMTVCIGGPLLAAWTSAIERRKRP